MIRGVFVRLGAFTFAIALGAGCALQLDEAHPARPSYGRHLPLPRRAW